jgi:hypothetical protein
VCLPKFKASPIVTHRCGQFSKARTENVILCCGNGSYSAKPHTHTRHQRGVIAHGTGNNAAQISTGGTAKALFKTKPRNEERRARIRHFGRMRRGSYNGVAIFTWRHLSSQFGSWRTCNIARTYKLGLPLVLQREGRLSRASTRTVTTNNAWAICSHTHIE